MRRYATRRDALRRAGMERSNVSVVSRIWARPRRGRRDPGGKSEIKSQWTEEREGRDRRWWEQTTARGRASKGDEREVKEEWWKKRGSSWSMIAAKVVGGGQIRTKLLQHPTWASSLERSSGPRPQRSYSDIVRSKYLYFHGSGIDRRCPIRLFIR